MPIPNTLRETLIFEGVGLHTGEPCKIALHPAPPTPSASMREFCPTQITVRVGAHEFPARWDYVVDATRATVLGDGVVRVGTVEHLMAALWLTGVTHCVIEVLQGREVPILDGSALPFVEAIGAESRPLHTAQGVHRAVQVASGERYLALSLSGDWLFGYIQFPEPLGVQAGAFRCADAPTSIAPARTFGFLHEVEALRRQGLARGGALHNALVIDENGYHNPARFTDEPLRHKLLDALGDIYLCGVYLPQFTLVAVKPGHALNVQLARLLAQALNAEDNLWRSSD
ncbi:MAG: UDP-3-O-acyl-N-acetylglucosamine deacetylase [Fimbriimonadales bacterium]